MTERHLSPYNMLSHPDLPPDIEIGNFSLSGLSLDDFRLEERVDAALEWLEWSTSDRRQPAAVYIHLGGNDIREPSEGKNKKWVNILNKLQDLCIFFLQRRVSVLVGHVLPRMSPRGMTEVQYHRERSKLNVAISSWVRREAWYCYNRIEVVYVPHCLKPEFQDEAFKDDGVHLNESASVKFWDNIVSVFVQKFVK